MDSELPLVKLGELGSSGGLSLIENYNHSCLVISVGKDV